jgi:hypothetical protein
MSYLKKFAAAAGIAGALTVTGLGPAAGLANADAPSPRPAVTASNLGGIALTDWGYGPYGPGGGPGYGPGYGYSPGYGYGSGYNGACAWVPPFVSQWIPPAACGG